LKRRHRRLPKPLAIVTNLRAVSFLEVSKTIAKVLKKKGVKVTIYGFNVPKIQEHNILFVGNVFHLAISYCQRFLPERNLLFYAITEGTPILDSLSAKIAKDITFITPSLYTKQCLEAAGLNCEAVIHHGIDMKWKYDVKFHDYIKHNLPNPSKAEPTTIYLNVSGNWRRKALDKQLVAYKTVEHILKDSFLILHSGIGDTNIVALQETLELKRFWLTNMWGTLSNAKLASLFNLCDIYVQPSMVEGFGVTYLEAFRFNKPVIAVDCPATNEIVKDGQTGLLIPVTSTEDIVWQQRHAIRLHKFDIDRLIGAMLVLADPKTRETMSENIKQEKHHWDMNKHYPKFMKYLE